MNLIGWMRIETYTILTPYWFIRDTWHLRMTRARLHSVHIYGSLMYLHYTNMRSFSMGINVSETGASQFFQH